MHEIVQIYNRVLALDLSQNFINAQYSKNKSIQFDKLL